MCHGTVYLQSQRRKPVRLGFYREPDAQGAIPKGWCPRCGLEIFGTAMLCLRCERRVYGESESLPALQGSSRPGTVQ